MLQETLVYWTGDFGRTPRINPRGGRDHWATLSTLALAGGGLRTGQVIGRSTRMADVPYPAARGRRRLRTQKKEPRRGDRAGVH